MASMSTQIVICRGSLLMFSTRREHSQVRTVLGASRCRHQPFHHDVRSMVPMTHELQLCMYARGHAAQQSITMHIYAGLG